jgi:hypothetical protein
MRYIRGALRTVQQQGAKLTELAHWPEIVNTGPEDVHTCGGVVLQTGQQSALSLRSVP